MEETNQKLTLQPHQYVIFNPGLKIENTSDFEISFILPKEAIYRKPRDFDIIKKLRFTKQP